MMVAKTEVLSVFRGVLGGVLRRHGFVRGWPSSVAAP
jgi:hypothetical protein